MHFPKRTLLQPVVVTAGVPSQAAIPSPVTANVVSEKIDMTAVAWWSVHSQWNASAGTLVGTVSFEASNIENPSETFASTDWVTLTTSPATVSVTSGQGSSMVRGGPDAFRWLRVKFTFTSGSGTLVHTYVGRGNV
jgi:hypothetical protein